MPGVCVVVVYNRFSKLRFVVAGRLVRMPVMLREMGLLNLVMSSPGVRSEKELETSEEGSG